MIIGLLNERVTFQRQITVMDEIGNQTNEWDNFYSCYCTIGGEGLSGSKESNEAGVIHENGTMTVTVRFCKKLDIINTTDFRIKFKGEIYNIESIDHMNYKRKSVKFHCRRVRR